jgi:hypothetical protein
MLVLEPIFEADLPPEIYAYRAGRNAQQAAVEVEDGRPSARYLDCRSDRTHIAEIFCID